jgi:hypothetical protein
VGDKERERMGQLVGGGMRNVKEAVTALFALYLLDYSI